MTKEEITEVGGGQSISLRATRGTSQDEASISTLIALANAAFRTGERTFCGTLETAYISDDSEYDNFINVDLAGELVTIAPQLEDRAGYYD